MRFLRELHKSDPFHLVHSFWLGEASNIAASFARKENLTHILTLMGQDAITKSLNSSVTLSETCKPNLIISLSKFHRIKFKHTFRFQKCETIPWGIDEIKRNEIKRDIDIIGVGNLIELKEFNRFIEIIYLIKKQNPEIKVMIVGKGLLESELKERVKYYQMAENINFTGEIPRAEVLNLLQRSKMLVHTSNYESFGYVLLEALASGCQVVSTPVGYACENDAISTFTTNEEAVNIILKKLTLPLKEIHNLPTMKETVKIYSEIYYNHLTK